MGRAVALAFAAEGDHVVVAGRDPGRLDETVEAAAGLSGTVVAVPTDVRDYAAVASLFNETCETVGRLDVLFNNAGMNLPSVPLDELDTELIFDIVAINIIGMLWCTREAMRVMKRQTPQGGRIINNGSISADRPRPNSAPYTATKHAVTGLTKSTILDGRSFGIAAGQIDIGNADTDMAAPMERGIIQPGGRVAVEPVMDVENVGRTVVHMASLPLEANIAFVTIMATTMPLYGRG